NALVINLEVLTEKLKDDRGAVAPALDKHLRVMREQVFKVDGILRAFSEFLVTEPNQLADLSLAQVLERAQEVLGHDARKKRVGVKLEVEPGVTVRMADPLALRFLTYQSLHRALLRSAPGSEIEISLYRAGDRAVLRVQDSGGDEEPDALSRPALEALGQQRSIEVNIHGGRCEMEFPAG
ncbi:MAG TPA: histidine kinase, partial [Myxococcales bacterium]|nr:histidine kinase [Myxococcales bacterium]